LPIKPFPARDLGVDAQTAINLHTVVVPEQFARSDTPAPDTQQQRLRAQPGELLKCTCAFYGLQSRAARLQVKRPFADLACGRTIDDRNVHVIPEGIAPLSGRLIDLFSSFYKGIHQAARNLVKHWPHQSSQGGIVEVIAQREFDLASAFTGLANRVEVPLAIKL
jgi:hypothetical protein